MGSGQSFLLSLSIAWAKDSSRRGTTRVHEQLFHGKFDFL